MLTSGLSWYRSIHTRLVSIVVVTTAMVFMQLAPSASFASLLGDFDARNGSVEPSAAQLAAVASLGAKASWNKLGTPSSLIKYGDYLATGLSGPDATTVARNWIDANKALFRLSSVDSLAMMSDEAFPYSEAYAVTFRQEVDGLRTAEDGVLTVGIVGNAADGWKIAYVSATTTGDASLSGTIAMTAAEAYIKAAQNIGGGVQISDIATTKADGEWTIFSVNGIENEQRARMRALPTPMNGVRPVYETVYLQVNGGSSQAYVHYIDAENGTVWMRKDIVDQSHPAADTYSGALGLGDGDCAIEGPWTVDPGEEVGSISASVIAELTTNDSTIDLLLDGAVVASQDTLFSPEVVVYSPAGPVPSGTYTVQICDYVDGAGWSALNSNYSGQIIFSDVGAPSGGLPYPPKWNVFPANPLYGSSSDNRDLWCWENLGDPNCAMEIINLASRSPWDYSVQSDTPTFTTIGNNAQSAEAWVSPLTPGGTFHRPTAADRIYDFSYVDQWRSSACFPEFVSGVSQDISAAVTNLFAMHNRVHDWSYHLGFTERRWNAQENNFGNNSPGTADGDPVIGNAQAGAATGGFPSYLGRDNANMITLPDGVPPITNMYLWQPIAGAFYAPCSDGDYDMAIIGHEYGHMTENRMIGKGDGRSGHHAGAMGESFGDFSAAEYINEYGFAGASGENPFSVGGFATGNGERAIRNYNMSYPRTGGFPEPGSSTTGSGLAGNVKVNPLNFSNMGYDLTGPQVHADGEIWSATNFTVRQYLVDKYNATHPESDAALQEACADGEFNPANCPGNRRWIQIVFDAMLLMPTAPSMLEARDAYLAADMMRFGGDNQAEIWLAFAHRGMGGLAESDNTINDPMPDFSSPLADNATVTFSVLDETGAPIAADIFVGHFEAGVSKIADTSGNTSGAENLDDTAGFAPGPYEFVARADGFGHFRFAQTFGAGETKTITVTMPTNHASTSKGGQIVLASSDGSQHGALIDDTEASNWDKAADGVAIDVGQPQVTVDLGGIAAVTINRVQVSAMLFGQNRFTALREFKVQTATNPMSDLDFTDWIVSSADAFPGHTPRPVSPEMILRSFDGPERMATHVRIVALNNQCTGNPLFQDDGDAATPDHDNDPANTTDCRVGVGAAALGQTIPILGGDEVLAARHDEVHIAELQVFGAQGSAECTSGCDNGGGNTAPVANDDSATTPQDTPVTINVLDGSAGGEDTDADGDTLTVTAVTDPANGMATNNGDGTITYTPDVGFVGTDTFQYTISDGNGGTDTATVTVTVTDGSGGNNDPVADDESASTPKNTPVTVDVLDGDTDPDGDTLSVASVTQPANGMVVNNGDGTVTYTPDTDFVGTDTFEYTVSDGNGGTDTGTVTITVTDDPGPVNECADDTDSDYHDCRVKGSGKIGDGDDANDDSDSDKFTIETKQKGANPDGSPHVDGKLYFDTDYPTRKVRGTPNAQSIDGNMAVVTGVCEYEFENDDKIGCTFEVDVTDPDQFGIKIYDTSGGLLYSFAKQTIIYGGIEVTGEEP